MRKAGLLIAGLFLVCSLLAQVSPRNGSYYVAYNDISFSNAKWEVNRAYNSSSLNSGLFGMCWNSDFQTHLFLLPDGQLTVAWAGGVRSDVFVPAVYDRSGMYQMIDQIVENEIEQNRLERTPSDLVRRRAELATDRELRAIRYTNLFLKERLKPDSMQSARPLRWMRNVNEVIEWTGTEYQFQYHINKYRFDAYGRLLYLQDATDRLRLEYTQGRLNRFILNDRQVCSVSLDSAGRIQRLQTLDTAGKPIESRYEYDARGYLVFSIDAQGNQYRYVYDANSNIVQTRYSNGTYRQLDYDPATGRVVLFREKTGQTARYKYGNYFLPDGRLNPDYYYTQVNRYDSLGSLVFNEYYDYEWRYTEQGETYLYRSVSRTDTSYEEYVYPPLVGNVIYRRKGDQAAWSSYDAKSRPVYLRLLDSVYITQYNVLDLPALFQSIDSLRRDTITYRYKYGSDRKLTRVTRNGVVYSLSGSIASGQVVVSTSSNRLTLLFTNGNPEYIIDPRLGRLAIDKLDQAPWAEVLAFYRSCLDVLVPKKIQHEWIWERM